MIIHYCMGNETNLKFLKYEEGGKAAIKNYFDLVRNSYITPQGYLMTLNEKAYKTAGWPVPA
jgi:hypothetical protein